MILLTFIFIYSQNHFSHFSSSENVLGQFGKSQQVYLNEKEGEALSAIRNNVTYNAENLVYEAKSGKESSMDQELDICNRVYM